MTQTRRKVRTKNIATLNYYTFKQIVRSVYLGTTLILGNKVRILKNKNVPWKTRFVIYKAFTFPFGFYTYYTMN